MVFAAKYKIHINRRFITRVSFPLAFNFLWMVNIDDNKLINVVDDLKSNAYFGTFSFSKVSDTYKEILPILLLLLTAFNLFNFYDRILKAIGVTRF